VGILDGWRFCPRCATPVTPAAGHVACPACGETYWANSVPAIEVVIEREGRVLLARRAHDPRAGLWDLPGGFTDEGEEPLAALEREVREETGLRVEGVAFLGIWIEPDYDGRSVFSVTYRATVGDGEPAAADDVSELRWFAPDELPPEEDYAFAHTPLALRRWRQQHA
jgi:ADP-ribose pyrophosphatase YjhB (NUDIX family)